MYYKKLLYSLLVFSFMTPALLAAPISVQLNKQPLSLHESPIQLGKNLYLPLESFSDMGCSNITYDKVNGQVMITTDTGSTSTLPISPSPNGNNAILKNSQVYLPIRPVCETLDYTVKWDATTQILDLTKDNVQPHSPAAKTALTISQSLKNKDFNAVTALLDKSLATTLHPQDLKNYFTQLDALLGPIKSYNLLTTYYHEDNEQVDLLLNYEQASLTLTLVINTQNKISGFHTSSYIAPTSLPAGVVEKELSFGSETYPLSGTLTLPNAKGAYPVVILVHDLGTKDRNETLYNTHFFRDIAYGLAQNGIATFRYDQRAVTYTKTLKDNTNLTLDDLILDDALAAIDLMTTTKNIRNNQIYVLGHGLGGMLVPMINKKENHVAGYIMASAPARPLPDVLLEEYSYLASTHTSLNNTVNMLSNANTLLETNAKPFDLAAYMAQIQEFVDSAKNTTFNNHSNTLGLAGYNDYFWAALNNYNQLESAQKLTVPTLITQGERDYEVSMTDFKLWQSSLRASTNVTFKSYPNLNHLYIKGSQKSTPEEYLFDSSADKTFINDLATWINALAQ